MVVTGCTASCVFLGAAFVKKTAVGGRWLSRPCVRRKEVRFFFFEFWKKWVVTIPGIQSALRFFILLQAVDLDHQLRLGDVHVPVTSVNSCDLPMLRW